LQNTLNGHIQIGGLKKKRIHSTLKEEKINEYNYRAAQILVCISGTTNSFGHT
jgi:hypothetical protein